MGEIKPTTYESTFYNIIFEEYHSEWEIVDSRGIFETTTPTNAIHADAIEYLKADIKKRSPDVILHVLSASEIRTLSNDMIVIKDIINDFRKDMGIHPPVIVVINKADALGNPRDWPPEKSAIKAGLIKDSLAYLSKEILQAEIKNIDISTSIKGFIVADSDYVGIIPVCSLSEDLWNIETLAFFLGSHLPESAQLMFFQAQRNKSLLKKISSSLIKKFLGIAGIVGSSPIPISDIIVLTPLQILFSKRLVKNLRL